MSATFTPRTPLEAALGTRLALDMSDLDAGNYEAHDAADAAYDTDLLNNAIDMGEYLYRESIRTRVAGMGASL